MQVQGFETDGNILTELVELYEHLVIITLKANNVRRSLVIVKRDITKIM